MKATAITLIVFLLMPSTAFSSEESEELKFYREKMDYWMKRGNSAFQCKNRFELALFLFDSTFEEGAEPSEELAEFIEEQTLNKIECVQSSLSVLPKDKIEVVIKHYYLEPLHRNPESFKGLIERLRTKPILKRDAPTPAT